jgi:uncharacterized paraquat-inducible protein A
VALLVKLLGATSQQLPNGCPPTAQVQADDQTTRHCLAMGAIGHVDERGACTRRCDTPIMRVERVRIRANMVHCLVDHAQLANAHAQ